MKKFIGTRIGTIIITALVASLVMSAVAFGAGVFNKPLAASAKIIPGNPDLVFYSDSALTTPITTLAFGDVFQGNVATVEFFYKNTGTLNFAQISFSSDIPAEAGTMTFTPTSVSGPGKNMSGHVTVTLTPKVGGTITGDITPTITVACAY